MGKDSQVNRGKSTQNTRVQKNDATTRNIANQNKTDRSTIRDVVNRLNTKRGN